MRVVKGVLKKSCGGRGERCRTAARDAPEGGPWVGEGWSVEAGAGRPFGPAGGARPAGAWLAQPKFGLPAVRKFAENFMLGARSTF